MRCRSYTGAGAAPSAPARSSLSRLPRPAAVGTALPSETETADDGRRRTGHVGAICSTACRIFQIFRYYYSSLSLSLLALCPLALGGISLAPAGPEGPAAVASADVGRAAGRRRHWQHCPRPLITTLHIAQGHAASCKLWPWRGSPCCHLFTHDTQAALYGTCGRGRRPECRTLYFRQTAPSAFTCQL